MKDRDELRLERKALRQTVRDAFIDLRSHDKNVALPAVTSLIGVASDEDKFVGSLVAIDADALKGARSHPSAEVRKQNDKLIEWINFRACEKLPVTPADIAADRDAGINAILDANKIMTDVTRRFKSGTTSPGDVVVTMPEDEHSLLSGLPDPDNTLLDELRGEIPRSDIRSFELIESILDFDVVGNPARAADARALAANMLTECVAKADEPKLLGMFRIVDVPKLRAAGEDQNEEVQRPARALIHALAAKAGPFFGIEPEQAEADPAPVLDALQEIKSQTEAEPGKPVENLSKAMIARRNSFKPNG